MNHKVPRVTPTRYYLSMGVVDKKIKDRAIVELAAQSLPEHKEIFISPDLFDKLKAKHLKLPWQWNAQVMTLKVQRRRREAQYLSIKKYDWVA